MTYFLSKAGAQLRAQIDALYPARDKRTDGWIGDASHQAAKSDHNPDYSTNGAVRAIDVDSNLEGGESIAEAQKLADALIKCARDRKDNGRLSYVIFNKRIASGTYASTFWTWRAYDGSDPHTSHIHVSFKPIGDNDGRPFDLALTVDKEDAMLDEYIDGQNAAQAAYKVDGKVGAVAASKPRHFKAGWNEVRWQVNNLRGKDGADGAQGPKGDKGEQGVQGLPGASHSHAKVSVAGPVIETP